MEEIVSSRNKKSKLSKKHEKSSESSSSDHSDLDIKVLEENESGDSDSSESSESESSENEEAYVFRDSVFGTETIKVEEKPNLYAAEIENSEIIVKVKEEEYKEFQINEMKTDKFIPQELSASSSSSSSSSSEENEEKITEIFIETNTEKVNSNKVIKEITESVEFTEGYSKNPDPDLESLEPSSKRRISPKFSLENIEIQESPEPIPNYELSNEVPYEITDMDQSRSSSSSSSSSSSKSNEKFEINATSSLIPKESEAQRKNREFADISSIDIYSSHFVNINDKSDYSIEIGHPPLEFEEEGGRKSSIQPKNEDFSGSEDETFQELEALENAFNKHKRKSSESSDTDKKSELDQAVVIDNSEIHERDSSDSSGIDEVDILKRIQTEPSELNEANFKDIEIYEKIQDPPVEKIKGNEEVVEYKEIEVSKRVLEEIPEEKEGKRSSSSSSSRSSSISSGYGSSKVNVVEIKKEIVVKEENHRVVIDEEVKVKEVKKNGEITWEEKREVEVKSGTEKNMIKNSLVDGKRNETENKKKRDHKSGNACSNCLVF